MGYRWLTKTGYRRTIVVGAVSAGLLLVGLRPASGSPAAPPAPRAAAFSNGQAKATAIVTKIGPGVGNLELALGSGVAVSELKNGLAQAQAQALDLGLIGTTLTADGCSGAALKPEQLPQPTRVDNREGDTSASTDYVPIAGSTLGAGRGIAEATDTPSATAIATAAASDGPAISLGGGKATAVTEVIDGAERQAHATVELDLELAGGALELSGLHWDAVHRTGKAEHVEATFDIGTAKLAGVAIPLDSLAAAQDLINTALEQTGISIQMPHVERFKEPTDLVRITPLLVTLRDSPAGKAALGPGLNASRQQREQLFTQLAGAFCQAAGLLLVGDIGVSIASGTGFVTYGFGGAEAISGEFIAENPFGDAIAPPSGNVAPPASGNLPSTAPLAPPAPPAAETPSADGQPIADVGPLEELCKSVHPFEWPDCSKGAMAPLGILGVLATSGMAALDWRHQRRRLGTSAASATPAASA